MSHTDFQITRPLVAKLLKTVDAGLVKGVGRPVPGQMCVEAAVCYAMGLPHGDQPTCVDDAIRTMKIKLNDSEWSSNESRAAGMRRLAVLQLGTKDNFNRVEFAKKLALFTIKTILPLALTAAGLHDHAASCSAVITLSEGQTAARAAAYAARAARAATDAADAAYVAYAAYAARAVADAAYAARAATDAADAVADAAYAARAAAYAAYAAKPSEARDKVLATFAKGAEDILISMNVPGVSFLDMLE